MPTHLFINNLVEWISEDGKNKIDRVLWIDEGYKVAFLIDIYEEKSLPRQTLINEIEECIKSSAAIVIKKDPWALMVTEERLSSKDKMLRDAAWKIISPIVNQEPSIYDRNQRGSLVLKLIEDCNIARNSNEIESKLTKKTVYKYLKRYWQRGKNINALLPDYRNSGGKGKQKLAGNVKRGRPRKYANNPEIGIGINVTEETKMTFRVAFHQFYHKSQKRSLVAAYEKMIQEYYSEEDLSNYDDLYGSIPMQDRIPSLVQFKYWYDLEHGQDIEKKISTRFGKREYLQNYRPITGNSTFEVNGPGARYEVDATVGDIYLVSSYNRKWIIGRPVIYVVVDVFSRMITGVYVGLEGPSWLGMMMALANTAMDKVEYCRQYEIDISEDDWPCHHLPDAFFGDRGELLSKNADMLTKNLNIKIENAPPYRPDRKGIVERGFRTINEKVKPFIPGAVDIDFKQRGGRDYRLDAKLDLDQFTKIIIRMILKHNNHHLLKKYPRTVEMIADEVLPIPSELWKWGIVHCSGKLKTVDPDTIKLNLMPKGNATITESGIKFKSMYYTCDRAVREMWFSNARAGSLSRAEKKIEISYDPRKADYIYIPDQDGRSFTQCILLESESKYENRNLYDIEYLFAEEELQQQKIANRELPQTIDLNVEIDKIVDQAVDMANDVQDPTLSNRKRTSEIRDNRSIEKENRREEESFDLSPKEKDSSKIASKTNPDKSGSISPKPSLKPNYTDLLRAKREQNKREKN
jgi:Integrase core domain/Mu transposase, C-terminal